MQAKTEFLSWWESECDAAISADARDFPGGRPGHFDFDFFDSIDFLEARNDFDRKALGTTTSRIGKGHDYLASASFI